MHVGFRGRDGLIPLLKVRIPVNIDVHILKQNWLYKKQINKNYIEASTVTKFAKTPSQSAQGQSLMRNPKSPAPGSEIL